MVSKVLGGQEGHDGHERQGRVHVREQKAEPAHGPRQAHVGPPDIHLKLPEPPRDQHPSRDQGQPLGRHLEKGSSRQGSKGKKEEKEFITFARGNQTRIPPFSVTRFCELDFVNGVRTGLKNKEKKEEVLAFTGLSGSG